MSGRRVLVTGSVATDHLMEYPGRFADQIVGDRLARVSLSFLADTLEVRPGGVAANIALGLARLGLTPVLAAAAGRDFGPYGSRLRAEGVETGAVRVSDTLHTARFVCTTDAEQNQIATFYAGAMAEARHIRIADVTARHGPFGMALIGPDDPRAMVRHTEACRERGIPFAADPSQQLARLDRAQTRSLVTGSRFLFTNEYEAALLQERTGWTHDQVLDRTGTWIVTRGADGVELTRTGHPPLRIAAVPPEAAGEPTGAGDGFRAGFLAATAWGRPPRGAARLGCALATVVLEAVGPQQYAFAPDDLARRLRRAYGTAAAHELTPYLARLPGERPARGEHPGENANRHATRGVPPGHDENRATAGDASSGRGEARSAVGGTSSGGGAGWRAAGGTRSEGGADRRADAPSGRGEGRSAVGGASSYGDEGMRVARRARSEGSADRRAGGDASPGRGVGRSAAGRIPAVPPGGLVPWAGNIDVAGSGGAGDGRTGASGPLPADGTAPRPVGGTAPRPAGGTVPQPAGGTAPRPVGGTVRARSGKPASPGGAG